MKKKKYDTSIVMLYLLRQEHLLPKEFRKTIPYSTIASWRKSTAQAYEGSEFRFLFDDNWDLVRLKHENQRLKKTLRSLARSYLLLKSDLADFVKKQKKDKPFQIKAVQAIQALNAQLHLKLALKLLFTHRNQYYEWAIASNHNCSHSATSLCLRRYPRQLQQSEVDKIKAMLTSHLYENWPIVSIAAQGLRKGNVVASKYVWYKYARILNLPHKGYKKTTKQVGLCALNPNEYLHIDTTYYPLSTGVKACITIVMDNYSKMILGFDVQERLSFTLVKTAIQNALIPILSHGGEGLSHLVSDGGWENNSSEIREFIASLSDYRLCKLTALKDIQFSNSPVEAIHKIIKGRYLQNKAFDSIAGLTTYLTEAIEDYNYKRPHYKHFPKTPAEVYFNKELKINFQKRIAKAIQTRANNNATTACTVCKMTLLQKAPYTTFHALPHPALVPNLR